MRCPTSFAIPVLLLAAGLGWTGIANAAPPETGSASTAPEVHALEPFTRLELMGVADIVLIQGQDESIEVEHGNHDGGRVDAVLSGTVLRVSVGGGRHWWDWMLRGSAQKRRIILRFKTLSSISASGDLKITSGAMNVPDLRFSGSGTTVLRIEALTANSLRFAGAGAVKGEMGGRVTDQHISISGAGEYRGEKLASETASVSVSGAGKVIIAVEKTLRASISGAGIVEYFGDPVVKQSVTGAGRVKRRETAELPLNAPVASQPGAAPA